MSDDLRYPIGRFRRPESVSESERNSAIEAIAALPGEFRNAVNGWTDERLDTPYREDGWTVRQVVHHVPDSHVNSYIRSKFDFTEDEPTIKPYDENIWANLIDGKTAPVEPSLNLLEGLHYRWVMLLRSLSAADV